jgi:tRNA 2-thiouridine synthesizing protein A
MDAPESTADVRLDCRGLLCPLPVYKAGVALNRMAPGEVLELTTTDPGSIADVPAMARQRGDRLISSSESEGFQVFLIEKGAA